MATIEQDAAGGEGSLDGALGEEGRHPPARAAPRDPRAFRLYRELHDELSARVRELETEGFATDRTELLHALLYFELPTDANGARELLRRWRRLQVE